ncbi:MAG TPA: flagellar hook-basal body complex protein FliE [Bryobacteraceae bacterium]|nr:flagellar hook-basal body complex protein FliE [Bryobacteraceae bacterium]
MPGPIVPISGAAMPAPVRQVTESSGGSGFQDAFASAIQSVEASRQSATASVEQFLNGNGEELHTAVMATQRAELTFELFMQVRNKVVSAYQEIMRMQM